MAVIIRDYQPADRPALVRLLEQLQDFQAALDETRHMRRLPEYGELYAAETLAQVARQHGTIYLAEENGEVLGCIVGYIREATPGMRAAIDWTRAGYIDDLVVREDSRSKGVGALLIKQLEDYFRQHQCQVVGVDALSANSGAVNFYARRGYRQRLTFMQRPL
jgi:ribosomal protein S18 acetylase RimI-like enzyme